MEIKLSELEQLKIENLEVKVSNLQLQIEALRREENLIVNNICNAHNKKPEEIIFPINLGEGKIRFKDRV